jgi:hypothetical protein
VVADLQALFSASGNSASPKRGFLPLWSSATGPFTNLAAGTGLAATPFEKCAAFASEFFTNWQRCLRTTMGVARETPGPDSKPAAGRPGLTDARGGVRVASTDLTMSELVEVELVEGPALLAAVSSELRNFGYLLTCDRCKNSRELISAILVIPGSGASWALCGPCLRQLPKSLGHVV